MSRRALLHARLDRRLIEGKDGKTGIEFRYAVPGSATSYREQHCTAVRPRQDLFITTAKKPEPDKFAWRQEHAIKTSSRLSRAIRHAQKLRRDGAKHVKLWQLGEDANFIPVPLP